MGLFWKTSAPTRASPAPAPSEFVEDPGAAEVQHNNDQQPASTAPEVTAATHEVAQETPVSEAAIALPQTSVSQEEGEAAKTSKILAFEGMFAQLKLTGWHTGMLTSLFLLVRFNRSNPGP